MISLFTFTCLSRSVVLIVCWDRFSGFHVVFRKIFRQSLEICWGFIAKIEHHAQFIPAIQIHSLTELAVASHAYLFCRNSAFVQKGIALSSGTAAASALWMQPERFVIASTSFVFPKLTSCG